MTAVMQKPLPHRVRHDRHMLVYVLHSSDMYGTERMAIATAQGLADEFQTIFIGPPGPALDEAKRLGFGALPFRTSKDLAVHLRPILRETETLTFVATGPRYSLVCMALNVFYRRRIKQIQIIHGGAGERKDYARKKFLSPFNLTFVTVSEYGKRRLVSHGVPAERIEIVLNFLPPDQLAAAPRRGPLTRCIQNAVVASRTVELKRLDLLLDAMELQPALADFPVDVLGDGEDFKRLCDRARVHNPNVRFLGFQPDVASRYAAADLLIHTCPTEQFGLVILEAMAAEIPILVPDHGGAAGLIEEGVTGFQFRHNDPAHLAERLTELRRADPAMLNRVVANAAEALRTRYSAQMSLERYRHLFAPPA